MNSYIPHPMWLIGFIVLMVALTAIAIIHTKAAKKDRVNHTKRDTIADSVSTVPSKKEKK